MNFIKRYPVFFYFLLTFIISWGGIILVIGGLSQLTVRNENFNALWPMVILAILGGPILSGIIMTIIVNGRNSWRYYKDSFKCRVRAKWYAIALLLGPLLVAFVYFALSLFSDKFTLGILTVDNKISYLIMGLITGVAAGFFEEIGWTGFAIPQLRKKYGVLKVGLIVGLLWALWHTLPGLWLGYASGTVTSIPLLFGYFVDSFLFLVIFRILMVWVYDKTESLFIAMIMHGGLTAAARIFTPIGIVGIPLLIFDITWAIVLLFVTIVIFKKKYITTINSSARGG